MVENLYFFSIVVLIIIIVYMTWTNAQIFDSLVNGFYESDSSFCVESGLETFCIYIDDDIKNGERACYILAKRDNEIVINEPCTVKLTLKTGTMCDTGPKYFTAEFKDLSDDIIDIFPQQQNLQFYPSIGKIILHDQQTVTYVGYKNGINTEMKAIKKNNGYDSDSE